jgi:hypothetical protein
MREITIYATRGGNTQKISTDVTTWGELQPLVRNAGFDLSSLMAAENVNKTDLVNDLAVLPSSDFRLFLRPKQTKSGSDRKILFEAIKEFTKQNPDKKGCFVVEGRNMTQLATSVLEDLYNSIIAAEMQQARAEVKSVAVEEADDVTRVLQARNTIAPLYNYDNFDKADKALKKLGKEAKGYLPKTSTEEDDLAREARELGY